MAVGIHGNLLTLLLGHYDNRYGFEFWRDDLTTSDVYHTRFVGASLVETERLYTESGRSQLKTGAAPRHRFCDIRSQIFISGMRTATNDRLGRETG